jgi:hypothetical protein
MPALRLALLESMKEIREMRNDVIKIAPSILAADFARLGEQVAEAERAGADRIHVDVMDGHFVPNIAIGAPIVQSLRRVTSLPLETHFMISNPGRTGRCRGQGGSRKSRFVCNGRQWWPHSVAYAS